ncbi:Ppx/GppA family phosphatase [Pacificimonas sp. WHA3]|uniref:Ppx/GppA family phosphatase n=2 Tax=Pacificimonas pallii TaxID=2827236 RepID=A0ABS6SF86_9SPHN|nr:Ppx/GppA family phosphatase [Pacificimonas pallii]
MGAPSSGELIRAIIDIGSNSIRLVVFRKDRRTPFALFNEKVMAGLGTGVAIDGYMAEANLAEAHSALKRFAMLCADMNVSSIEAFATAAVRDAVNGPDFVAKVKADTGIDIEVIDGKKEGRYAALGVLGGIPGADGIVGDLGGGSLELVRLKNGQPRKVMSLPIGSLKLAEARKGGTEKMQRLVKKALDQVDWLVEGKGLPFYMVGGSWRALAQLEMHLTGHPLHIVHQYELSTKAVDRLARAVPNLRQKRMRSITNVSTSRTPHLPGAALLLRHVMKRLGSSHAVVSAYGIREGVFFDGLPEELARRDPLISAAREEGTAIGRFPQHAGALMRWMEGMFEAEPAEETRLRRAAAELSDIAWRAHPDFRAERALHMALHGNWAGIDQRGRAMLGAALYALYGGQLDDQLHSPLGLLAGYEEIERATAWGLALRLGQRLTGGTAHPLKNSALRSDGEYVILELSEDMATLWSGAVERRLTLLAAHLAMPYDVRII